MISQGELLAFIERHLKVAQIPHMVVGSLASSFHGEPRTTADIDVLIDPSEEGLRILVAAIQAAQFYVDEGAASEALELRTSFNVVDPTSGWKVDLMMLPDQPFAREEMSRRIRVRLLGTETEVATAEDTIISKLQWAKAGGSDRQLRDVASIVAVSGNTLDQAYLARWIGNLGLADVWKRARRLTDEADA